MSRSELIDLVFDLWKPSRIFAGSLLHRVRLIYNDTNSPREPVVAEPLVKSVDHLGPLLSVPTDKMQEMQDNTIRYDLLLLEEGYNPHLTRSDRHALLPTRRRSESTVWLIHGRDSTLR